MTRLLETDYPPLMLAQLDALRRYAADHGRHWKVSLRTEWMCASADPLLHGLRNSHGPSWLVDFDLEAAPQPAAKGVPDDARAAD